MIKLLTDEEIKEALTQEQLDSVIKGLSEKWLDFASDEESDQSVEFIGGAFDGLKKLYGFLVVVNKVATTEKRALLEAKIKQIYEVDTQEELASKGKELLDAANGEYISQDPELN